MLERRAGPKLPTASPSDSNWPSPPSNSSLTGPKGTAQHGDSAKLPVRMKRRTMTSERSEARFWVWGVGCGVEEAHIRRPLSPKGRRMGRVCLCPCLSDYHHFTSSGSSSLPLRSSFSYVSSVPLDPTRNAEDVLS